VTRARDRRRAELAARREEPEREAPRRRRRPLLADVAIVVGAFAAAGALAGLLGAANFGTALSFGQMGFAAALVFVLLRR
jgi:hypothetical protein